MLPPHPPLPILLAFIIDRCLVLQQPLYYYSDKPKLKILEQKKIEMNYVEQLN